MTIAATRNIAMIINKYQRNVDNINSTSEAKNSANKSLRFFGHIDDLLMM
jgi:hypothetical protein